MIILYWNFGREHFFRYWYGFSLNIMNNPFNTLFTRGLIMQCLYNWLCFLCLHMSVCLCSCVCVSVLNLYNKTSKRCHVKVQNLNLENPHFLSVCFLFVRIDLLHAQRFRQFTQVFSNYKLTVQSNLGPQRWAQPGYWNVHRLCVSLTTCKNKNHNARSFAFTDWLIYLCSYRQ